MSGSSLLHQFIHFITANKLFLPKDKLLLAVSGGVDSVALTELCKQAGYDFVIAHCNFQLRGKDSDLDEEFVKQLAKKYNVEFFVKKFNTKEFAKQQKLSTQEAARDLRYSWFNEVIDSLQYKTKQSGGENTIRFPLSTIHLLTAHHADDNIETILMNFFRGTGIRGLRGIEPKQGNIVRPLLFARRTELEEFIRNNDLQFVQDVSNYEDDYTRNYVRNKLLPAIEEAFPSVRSNLIDNIKRFTSIAGFYEDAMNRTIRKLVVRKGDEVHIPVLKLQRSPGANTILYEVIKDFGFTSPQVIEVAQLFDSVSGKYVDSATHRILRNRKWLIIVPLSNENAEHILVETPGQIKSPIGKLSVELINNVGGTIPDSKEIACLNADDLEFPFLIRKWKTGDYFYPLGMTKKKKLARFFIDQKISRHEKEKIWVVEMNKKILWVIGHRIDDRFKVTPQTKNILQLTRG